jgi:DNA polymerase-3 subunit delta'
MQLILHETTGEQVRHFIASPSQAVLLTGANGIGKGSLATHIVATLLKQPSPDTYPHFMRITPEGSSISIEKIRELQKFLQLKTAGSEPLRRALVIEHAEALTTEAQNAYLKLLEEPPADTLMVLTAGSPRSLLPTIMSRLQIITVHAPTAAQLQPLLQASGKDETTLRQAYFLSAGLPGLLSALITGDETHPLLSAVGTAKDLLQKPPFERLSLVEPLSKQKDDALAVLDALDRMAQASLQGAAAKKDVQRLKQWHTIRHATHDARTALQRSGNTKLTLSNLFLHLPG